MFLQRILSIRSNVVIYLFKLQKIFVQIAKCICCCSQSDWRPIIEIGKIIRRGLEAAIFVQITKYICSNCKIYLFKFQNIFGNDRGNDEASAALARHWTSQSGTWLCKLWDPAAAKLNVLHFKCFRCKNCPKFKQCYCRHVLGLLTLNMLEIWTWVQRWTVAFS